MLWCGELSKKVKSNFSFWLCIYRDQVEVNRVNAEKKNKKEAKKQQEQQKKREHELKKNFQVRSQQHPECRWWMNELKSCV